jgi:hypothetical protein
MEGFMCAVVVMAYIGCKSMSLLLLFVVPLNAVREIRG